MKKALFRSIPVAALLVLVAAGAALAPQSASSNSPVKSKFLAHKLGVELGTEKAVGKEMPLSSGIMYSLLQGTGALDRRVAQWSNTAQARAEARSLNNDEGHGISNPNTEGCQNVFHGHGMTNTRVNQDCSLRRQAEEMILINPRNQRNIIAGQNDSRIGFNHCGYDWTFNGGRTWGDQIPPFYQFLQTDAHTADACSDPTGAWDSQGNAYVGSILFDIASDSSSVIVEKSNAGNGGAFYHSPTPGPFQEYVDNPPGVIAADSAEFSNDKELLTADQSSSSPKRDNVYMTWTRFTPPPAARSTSASRLTAPQPWSEPTLISGSSGSICGGPCNNDQGSSPVVGPDGTIYVAFANGNIPGAGIEQLLLREVPGLGRLQPRGELDTARGDRHALQHLADGSQRGHRLFGRQELPASERLSHGPRDVADDLGRPQRQAVRHLVGLPQRPRAVRRFGFDGNPPCDNDVFYSFSTTNGATWAPTRNITPRSRFGENAQWQPWSKITKDGRTLWVGYYDRRYGNCENTGCNDITAAAIDRPSSNNPSYDYTRVTTSSMPNLLRRTTRLRPASWATTCGSTPTVTVRRTSSGPTRARSGAPLLRRTSTTRRSAATITASQSPN